MPPPQPLMLSEPDQFPNPNCLIGLDGVDLIGSGNLAEHPYRTGMAENAHSAISTQRILRAVCHPLTLITVTVCQQGVLKQKFLSAGCSYL